MQQLADQVLAQARAGLSRAIDLEAEAQRQLLTTGMNPGGVDRSVMWTDLEEHQGEWQRLFDWGRSPPDYRVGLSGDEQAHRTRGPCLNTLSKQGALVPDERPRLRIVDQLRCFLHPRRERRDDNMEA